MAERWWGPVGRDVGPPTRTPKPQGRPGRPSGPGLSIWRALGVGALVGVAQLVLMTLTVVLPGPLLLSWTAALIGGPGFMAYRYRRRSEPRRGRRFLGAVGAAVGHGMWMFVLLVVGVGVLEPYVGDSAWVYGVCVLGSATAGYRAARRSVAAEPVRVAKPVAKPVAMPRAPQPAVGHSDAARARAAERGITEFGALLAAHPFSAALPGVAYEEVADHSFALDAYERAKVAPVEEVPRILAEGRAALARLDRRLGLDTAQAQEGCFFDPRHGPAVTSVRWTPPGGHARTVQVCQADAVRLADGERPNLR